MKRILACGAVAVTALFGMTTAQAATVLTDSAIFSANSEGNNWNGWIWNTQGAPADTRGVWNMYYSTSSDPNNPTFINSGNDTNAEIAIDLPVGTHDFVVFGESVTPDLDPLQHFVLNLYFNGNQSAPSISAVAGPSCATVCPAGHPNGLDLFGNSGSQEAGVVSFFAGSHRITLTKFDWAIGDVDKVWSYWANDVPYNFGSGTPDFVGHIQLQVAAVPLPAAFPLLAGAIAGLSLLSHKRRKRA